MKKAALAALAAACLAGATVGAAGGQIVSTTTTSSTTTSTRTQDRPAPEPRPTRERVRVHKPPRTVHRHRSFTPAAEPSPSKVHRIEDLEQARWGGPTLRNRVYCESTDYWHATNGQYRGLLQFGSVWGSMYAATPRGVRVRHTHHHRRPVWRIVSWSDGSKTRRRVRSRRQRVVVVRKGTLPSDADPYHGWAAIRVGQRAVSGDGPTTSWECGL